MRHALLIGAVLLMCSVTAYASCFKEAGARYSIDPLLLRAIARQESSLNPTAKNFNRDKDGHVMSIDYGLMMINSTHIPELIRLGVIKRASDLLSNPCLNVMIGAWILARHFKVCGISWICLGSYNAGFKEESEGRRLNYARRIYAKYEEELQGRAGG
ncbi:TPA: lytic transglycosylase domain-containing protein [Pseudomonas aeruginosa]|nr:lytic transglycosylase domain-containing protein [Pseudomonas aeruginosa]HDQ4723256.1 lytic transglycosylase domain-containing protein [Pseudomonas aeruginosa]